MTPREMMSEELHKFGLSIPIDDEVLYQTHEAILEYVQNKSSETCDSCW